MNPQDHQWKLNKLNSINEEIFFFENLGQLTPENEEELENLRLLRYELEKGLHYEQRATFKNDQANR